MNIYTKEIADLLNISIEDALRVQDAMVLDFSEATTREFNKAARFAHRYLVEEA